MNPYSNSNTLSKFLTRILGSIQEDEANDVGVDSAVPQFTLTLSCYINTKVPMEKQGCLDVVSDKVTHLVVCASHWTILDKVHAVAAREAASHPTGRAGATATGSERDLTCPPISQWAALEDKTLNIEQSIVINGVEYPFFYDARALMRGVNPIIPLVLRHGDQCPEVATLDYCQMVFDEMSWLNLPGVPGTDDYAVSRKVFTFLETVFCLWGLQTNSSRYSILEMGNESWHNSTS